MLSKMQKIEEEIKQSKIRLDFLENRLKELQQQCDHSFKGNTYYRKCVKCNKIEVFYY
ncbi:serine protease [Evansella halocellulosilytica]|uniref:serine protease n=1 Tax=Evansella halocellulosilytica TaxID=2011013 RepID=UPI000BB719DA|nr:serine protease [Evansella halocellulosilytica]